MERRTFFGSLVALCIPFGMFPKKKYLDNFVILGVDQGTSHIRYKEFYLIGNPLLAGFLNKTHVVALGDKWYVKRIIHSNSKEAQLEEAAQFIYEKLKLEQNTKIGLTQWSKLV